MISGKLKVIFGVIIISIVTGGTMIHVSSVSAKGSAAIKPAPTPTLGPSDSSAFAVYRGVSIRMKTDDLRTKLGNPKDKGDAQDYYVFSDTESAQFYYDDQHTVTAIMITYTGDLKSAPTPKDVFGEDVPPKPEGSISKMVRYPKAGYWIAYNRGSGSDAMLSIAIQKIQ